MEKTILTLLGIFAFAFIAASQVFYIVDEREQALVLQFGEPIGDESNPSSFFKGPGLHIKLPIIQNVVFFDKRILSVDPRADQVVISSVDILRKDTAETSEGEENAEATTEDIAEDEFLVTGEPIILDTFARYKITDPLQFLKTLRTTDRANQRLSEILIDATKAELGNTSLQQLLSTQRGLVMRDIQTRVNENVQKDELGIEIVDVRIVRADLTPELRTSTVRRMISELKERATETRAKGEERALEIRSTAEKERTVIIAEAERDAQITKGAGDNEAIKIYADAFNKDKEFYSFIRSMEAYSSTLADPETRLILSPDSEFFKHFGQ